jgi:hypothetical protein
MLAPLRLRSWSTTPARQSLRPGQRLIRRGAPPRCNPPMAACRRGTYGPAGTRRRNLTRRPHERTSAMATCPYDGAGGIGHRAHLDPRCAWGTPPGVGSPRDTGGPRAGDRCRDGATPRERGPRGEVGPLAPRGAGPSATGDRLCAGRVYSQRRSMDVSASARVRRPHVSRLGYQALCRGLGVVVARTRPDLSQGPRLGGRTHVVTARTAALSAREVHVPGGLVR